MNVPTRLDSFDHAAWATGFATVVGYAVLLLAVFGVLFVLPWLVLIAF